MLTFPLFGSSFLPNLIFYFSSFSFLSFWRLLRRHRHRLDSNPNHIISNLFYNVMCPILPRLPSVKLKNPKYAKNKKSRLLPVRPQDKYVPSLVSTVSFIFLFIFIFILDETHHVASKLLFFFFLFYIYYQKLGGSSKRGRTC